MDVVVQKQLAATCDTVLHSKLLGGNVGRSIMFCTVYFFLYGTKFVDVTKLVNCIASNNLA